MVCDLKEKFREWEEWLFGDDPNSIRIQIHNMVWDSAVFLSINKARKYAMLDKEGKPELNGMVHRFINRSFFQTQSLAIRKLYDKRSDVISLVRILNDMEKNRMLLTRKNITDAHDYPYDYESKQARLNQIRSLDKSKQDLVAQDLFNCHHSETIHERIDSLSDVDSSHRNRNDIVSPKIFDWLETKLSGLESIVNHVNKFIAHSATPGSRASIKADDIVITLGEILNAHKTICQTAEFIGMSFLYRSFGNFFAIPQYDQFEHFEKPWATDETVGKLYKFWREYDRETQSWKNWDWQREVGEYTSKQVK
jgi:hypothetical protein